MVDSAAPPKAGDKKHKAGLAHWMQRVLAECDNAGKGLEADPVHDLRVALRRCRSMADGLMAIDPDKSWKPMKKAGKPLFQSLGELRDAQVMLEWVDRLGAPDDPVTHSLKAFANHREIELKKVALQALRDFDRRRWGLWCNDLPRRAARVRPGSAVFKHMALERWSEARALQPQALRTHSQAALHRLRIALKRFRYTVENFLPQLHDAWIGDLKELQDWLGEIHDLDVLWATASTIGAFPDAESRSRWRSRISQERTARIEKYREKMVGKHSLWSSWRAPLPHGQQIQSAALSRLRLWASFLDPNFSHSRHVTSLALQLYEGLAADGLRSVETSPNPRVVLQAAALLHDVGRGRQEKNHHKRSARLIRQLVPPLGLTEQDLRIAAVVARYHRGALPQSRHKQFIALPAALREVVMQLAGILRLANTLDSGGANTPHLRVDAHNGTLRLYLGGYSRLSKEAENIASARHLLEIVLRRPVIVRRLIGSGGNRRRRTAKTPR